MISETSAAAARPHDPAGNSRYKWAVVAMLWFICFLNYGDRVAISSVFPILKVRFHLTATQLGIIGSAFSWVYAGAAPFAGRAGDLVPRKVLIIGGLYVWSLVTGFTGLCGKFWQFVAVRATEGLGETFYIPASVSLISDYHGPETRSRAIGAHQTSLYAGTVFGGALSGWMAARYGWQSPFVFLGSAGILLGLILAQFIREPQRGEAEISPSDTVLADGEPVVVPPIAQPHRKVEVPRNPIAGIRRCIWAAVRHPARVGVGGPRPGGRDPPAVPRRNRGWDYRGSLYSRPGCGTCSSGVHIANGAAPAPGVCRHKLGGAGLPYLGAQLSARCVRRARLPGGTARHRPHPDRFHGRSTHRGSDGRPAAKANEGRPHPGSGPRNAPGDPFLAVCGMNLGLATALSALACFGLAKGIHDANISAGIFDVVAVETRAAAVGLLNFVGWGAGAMWTIGFGSLVDRHVPMTTLISYNSGIYAVVCAIFVYAALVRAPKDVLV